MTAFRLRLLGALVVTLGTVTVSLSPVAAAPVTPAPFADAARDDVTNVQYRRGYAPYARSIGPRAYVAPRYAGPRVAGPRYYGRPYAGRGYGWRPFVGFGAAIVAGAVIANSIYAPRRGAYYDTYDYSGPYYYPNDYDGDPREICAKHFRSFEWDTGLITTYRGERRMCPYLGA